MIGAHVRPWKFQNRRLATAVEPSARRPRFPAVKYRLVSIVIVTMAQNHLVFQPDEHLVIMESGINDGLSEDQTHRAGGSAHVQRGAIPHHATRACEDFFQHL